MLRIFKVSEDSLNPVIREGDFVLTSKIPFLLARLKPGDIVVLDHPIHGRLIKKIEKISVDGQEIYVIGTHEFSLDSRQFGPVSRQIILGKVIWHSRRPGR